MFKSANREIKNATASPWFKGLARLGYVVRGALYALMGLFALGLVFGGSGVAADQKGVLYVFSSGPSGVVLLTVVIVALAAYSLWGFVRAIYDPLERGNNANGIVARLGFAWSGIGYATLLVFAAGFLVGTTKDNGSNGVSQLVQSILSQPAGDAIVIVAGVIGVITGLGQFAEVYKASSKKDLKRSTMNKAQRVTVDTLGRVGMMSRGVIFTMLGNYVLQAGLHNDPSQAHGIAFAFGEVAREPQGRVLLVLVALGFIALGLHSFANARWVRMPMQHS